MSVVKIGFEEPLPERDPAEVEALIEWAAQKITERKLELPATLFLEMHLPVAGLLHSAVLLGQPMLSPLFGVERIDRLAALVSDRQSLRRLLERIQAKAVANPPE